MNETGEEGTILTAEEAEEKIALAEEAEAVEEEALIEEEAPLEAEIDGIIDAVRNEALPEEAPPDMEEPAPVPVKRAHRRRWKLPLLLAGVLVLAGAFGFFWFYHKDSQLLAQETCYGAEAGGVVLDGMTREEAEAALLAAWPDEALEKNVVCTLACAEEDEESRITIDYADFSPHYDRRSALDAAWQVGRVGTRRERLAEIRAVQEARPVFDVERLIDGEAVRARVDELAEQLDREMKEASIEVNPETNGRSDLFLETDGWDGRKLDREALTAALLAAPDNGFSSIELPVAVEEMPATLEELQSHTQLLRSFTTKYDYVAPRVFNIHRAADTICGSVVAPGETFSFNGTVGNTSLAENGYKEWHVIVGGKDAMDRGGGVCQAATTLYNAAIRSGMEITERRPHDIASAYVPKGQDAAIAYGGCNVAFRNPTEYPVYIFCYYDNTSITFDIYGDPLPNGESIELESELLRTNYPGDPIITYDSSRLKGTRETTVSALNGYEVRVYRLRLDKDGKEIRREVDHVDTYPTRRAEIIEGTKEVPVPTPTPEPAPAEPAPVDPPEETVY